VPNIVSVDAAFLVKIESGSDRELLGLGDPRRAVRAGLGEIGPGVRRMVRDNSANPAESTIAWAELARIRRPSLAQIGMYHW
jgi:hypothetical protein